MTVRRASPSRVPKNAGPYAAVMAIGAADEHRHDQAMASGAAGWAEAWDLDFVTADGALAATFSMALNGETGRAGYALSLVGPAQDLVTLSDFDMRPPKRPGLEVRAPGLWSEFICQIPLDHFTVDVEAFGVELDDPEDVFRGAYGKRVAVGCELEWETDGPVVEVAVPGEIAGYAIPCRVSGEWLLDDATIEIEGWGWRRHRWGSLDQTAAWWRGRTADGLWMQGGPDDLDDQAIQVAAAPRTDDVRQSLVQTPTGLIWVDVTK